MLRLSKLTDYATVILSFLAQDSGTFSSAREIAEALQLKQPTVSKLLKILASAGLVSSLRGTEGGYQLKRPANAITLADVVHAVEGNLGITECCTPDNSCQLDASCNTKDNWKIINKIIFKALSEVTLMDMGSSVQHNPPMLKNIPIAVKSS